MQKKGVEKKVAPSLLEKQWSSGISRWKEAWGKMGGTLEKERVYKTDPSGERITRLRCVQELSMKRTSGWKKGSTVERKGEELF